MKKNNLSNLSTVITALNKKQIIAYPTESVFGLGCDPDSWSAVQTLLKLKKRPWQKGLILVASCYNQLTRYIDDGALNNLMRSRMFASWPGPTTWVVPALPKAPFWLTGQHKSLAVRISSFKPMVHLCISFGKALISTSANLNGLAPARTANEVQKQLGTSLPVLNEVVEGRLNPSEIRDVVSGKIIRYN